TGPGRPIRSGPRCCAAQEPCGKSMPARFRTGWGAERGQDGPTRGAQTTPPGEITPSAFPRLSLAQRRPVGVVGVIAPFNFPLILAIRSVAPALALGNAVVLKPDPRTAVSGGVTLARIFEEAGLPPGLLHVLPGGPDVGTALVEHPGVQAISFTGSSAAGRKVGEACGRLLK